MTPFEIHVHPEVRRSIPEPALTELATQTLIQVDRLVNSDDPAIKTTRLIRVERIPVKFVFVRGRGKHAVHLTLPKSLVGDLGKCPDCKGVGYSEIEKLHLCEKCEGLGSVATTPTGNL